MRRESIFKALLCACLAFSVFKAHAQTVPSGKLEIGQTADYDLSDIFKNASGDKAFYLTFKHSRAANFAVTYNRNVVVSSQDGFITIAQVDSIRNPSKANILYYAPASSKAAYIHLGYQIGADRSVIVQAAETDTGNQYVTSSPRYNLIDASARELPNEPDRIEISNTSTDSTLTIVRTSFVAISAGHENLVKRSANSLFTIGECLIPILSIANQILNTPCDLIPRAYSYIAGDRDASKSNAAPAAPPFSPTFTLGETYYGTDIDPYAAFAASRVCQARLSAVYSNRKPRSPGTADCIYDTRDILTPYLILANFDFDRDHFNSVVANILAHGASGIPNAQPGLEAQLVTAVQEQTRRAGASARQAIQRAFHEASALNASTVALAEILATSSANGGPSTSQGAAPQYGLGHYELNLQGTTLAAFSSRHPDTRPRAWNGSAFALAAGDFGTETLPNPTPAQAQRIAGILDAWYPDGSSSSDDSSGSDSDGAKGPVSVGGARLEAGRLLAQGRNLAETMREELDERDPNHVFFIVSYNGAPAAIVQAHVNRDVGQAVLIASLTNPANLRVPYASSAVRGAGQRALQELIKYCLASGITLINSNAVTRPSAHLKVKYGFKFEGDA